MRTSYQAQVYLILLLFLARADQGSQIMNKEVLNIESIIEELIRGTQLIAPEHQVIGGENTPALILADPSSIKQMLRIFIENSIKYILSGGMIRVNSQIEGNFLKISIQDTGIGIPQE